MARIYLSSTYRDLVRHRAAVYRALRRLGHDVVAMEDYVATDERPKDRCLGDVSRCDLYVGVFAWRVGFVPPGEDLSITELELRQAQASGKPALLFILDDHAPWPASRRDADPEPIRALRDRLQIERVVSRFRSRAELAELAAAAVTNRVRESSAAEVLVGVDVAPDATDQPGDPSAPAALVPRYRRIEGAVPTIEPRFEYVEAIARGEHVQGLGYMSATVFPARWPKLAVRIVNNAGVTIAIERVVLEIEGSEPLDWPLCVPAGYTRPRRHILVLNEGSGTVGPMALRYALLPWHVAPRDWSADELPHEIRTPWFESSWFADLSAGLAEEGVDIDALEALVPTRTSIGGPKSDMPGIWTQTATHGWLRDDDYKRLVSAACRPAETTSCRVLAALVALDAGGPPLCFESKIELLGKGGYFPVPKPAPPADASLASDRSDYEASAPLALVLESGKSTTATITVGAARASAHRLRVAIVYNHGRRALSSAFDLHLFVPRSSWQAERWVWMYAG